MAGFNILQVKRTVREHNEDNDTTATHWPVLSSWQHKFPQFPVGALVRVALLTNDIFKPPRFRGSFNATTSIHTGSRDSQ